MSEIQTLQELLEKAQQRDIEASKEILRRISDKMYFVTRLYIASHEEARSVEQAGLKKVFARLKEVTNPEWFESWVSEIVRKEAISRILPLTESTTSSNLYTEADEIPNHMAILPETTEGKKYQVLEMMDKLSTGARAALALHLYDGLSIEESAKLLMSTPQSVMSWITEAKDTLMNKGFNLGTLIILMEKLNPVSNRALVQKMHDDIALKSVEDDVLSSVFAQPVTPVPTPSFPDLPSTAGNTVEMPVAKDDNEDTMSSLPVTPSEAKVPQDSATQVLKKKLFDDDDEEVDDYEEEDSKGGNKIVLGLIIILLLMLVAGLGWIVVDKFGGGIDLGSIFGSKKDTTSIVASSDETQEATPTPEVTPEPTPEAQDNGEVEVVIESLNIRSGAGTDFAVVGTAYRGDKYTVVSIQQTNDYTWYQIGDNQWIADVNNQYITYRK